MSTAFLEWTGSRDLATIGTNAGSMSIPYQGWKPFKEAFAPELISQAVEASELSVQTVLDPFGGSGTSSLAAQFMGVTPLTVEVNPFLADVITAKLTRYDLRSLNRDFAELMTRVASPQSQPTTRGFLPPTFVEPGVKERYLFNSSVAEIVFDILSEIQDFSTENERFFRVMLSGILLEFSNARVSGKGRRYRKNWQSLSHSRASMLGALAGHVQSALGDVARFNDRECSSFEVLIGDSRTVDFGDRRTDLVVFSPPYPNSFDYTDVYNIELWMLGYFKGWEDNRALRLSTLSSHVQISRDFDPHPVGSKVLDETIEALKAGRDRLWDQRIPEMVQGYFSDLDQVISSSSRTLNSRGQVWMVVGDSRYGETTIAVADILSQLVSMHGLEVVEVRPFRSMRSSPQQGGRKELSESLLVLRKP